MHVLLSYFIRIVYIFHFLLAKGAVNKGLLINDVIFFLLIHCGRKYGENMNSTIFMVYIVFRHHNNGNNY